MEIGVQEIYGNMRLFKFALISAFVLFLIITLIGLLFPSNIIVSRAVDINSPKDSIYKYTRDLYGWKNWVSSLKEVEVTDSLVATLGKSTIKIGVLRNDKIEGEWIEKNGEKQIMSMSFFSSNNSPTTVVQWQFEQHIKWYPWARFGSIINDKVIGGMMENNLANLKKILENTN